MSDKIEKMRAEFEAAYAAHFKANTRKEITAEEVASMRTGVDYNFGGRVGTLNGQWRGWQHRQPQIDALEEKERALEWLLGLCRKSYGVDINNVSSVCSLRSRDIEDVVTTIGYGHTALDAVLDAMKREGGK